jgi:beta-lactam-binding protein with PASTA domain
VVGLAIVIAGVFEPPVFTRVPDVVGMDINSARAALAGAGLSVGRLSFGAVNKDCDRPEIVVGQSPGGGTGSIEGNKVDIVLDMLTLAAC